MLDSILLILALASSGEPPRMVRVPRGEFVMGDNTGDEDAPPPPPGNKAAV